VFPNPNLQFAQTGAVKPVKIQELLSRVFWIFKPRAVDRSSFFFFFFVRVRDSECIRRSEIRRI